MSLALFFAIVSRSVPEDRRARVFPEDRQLGGHGARTSKRAFPLSKTKQRLSII
jgi:hypothetical protein